MPQSQAKQAEPSREIALRAAIWTAVGRQMTGQTSIYMIAIAFVLPISVVSTIITIQYLTPAQFGELGLLMVMASFITLVYNIGILHGTFLWVYGTSGDMGDDVMDAGGQTDVASQRRALTTGLLISLVLAGAGTAIFLTFAGPLAKLLLGSRHAANLIGLAALSGGAGSIWRLTTNVFRFERRAWAYGAATIARPISVLIVSTVLIVAGFGVWGAVLGTAVPTVGCALGNIAVTWRNYALSISWHDMKQIAIRTAWVVLPLIGLNVVHNGDLVLLSHWVHGSQLGVYRLASRLASPPSYFASAVMMAWSPLERSPTFLAAFQSRGPERVRSFMLTYYIIAGLTIVVFCALFSHLFLLVAPASYREAAKIVPLGALAFVVYGLYIVVLRTSRPDPLIRWYTVTSVASMAVFIGSGFVFVPAFGNYGPPAAIIAGMLTGTVWLLLLNLRRTEERMPVQYRRIAATVIVASAISAAGIVGSQGGTLIGATIGVSGLILYFPLLVLSGAIPRAHLKVLRNIIPRRSERKARLSVDQLPPAEQQAIAQFRARMLTNARPVELARLTRALRRMEGMAPSSGFDDVRIGAYLASPDPESIRDWELRAIVEEGADAYELSRIEQLAKELRRGRRRPKRAVRLGSGALRARLRALEAHERTRLIDALSLANATNGSPNGGREGELARVRAVRAIRQSFRIGSPSEADFSMAMALWENDAADVPRRHREDLRILQLASRVAPRAPSDQAESGGASERGIPHVDR